MGRSGKKNQRGAHSSQGGRRGKGHAAKGGATAKDSDAPAAGDGQQSWTMEKRPILKAVGIFVLVMCAYYAIDYFFTSISESEIRKRYLAGIAWASSGLLRVLGYDAVAMGTLIRSSDFSVNIVKGCDALEPSAAFVAAVLASPVRFLLKLPGLAVGVFCLLTINLLRIVSLFYIGINWSRSTFDMMHYEVWQATFIVLAIVFWAIWVQWATSNRGGKSDVSA